MSVTSLKAAPNTWPILGCNTWIFILASLLSLVGCGQETVQEPAQPTDTVRAQTNRPTVQDAPSAPADSSPLPTPPQRDSISYLSFKDLSTVYNYKVIDRRIGMKAAGYRDSVVRVIKILDKKDFLIQRIYPEMQILPLSFGKDHDPPLSLSRSFVTGKNQNKLIYDDYYGEIVVADLNFDGLEDFGTPVDCGADNGPHYAFYIQDRPFHFKFNRYLTDKVVWFPNEFNDSLKRFTTVVPCMVSLVGRTTFHFDSISNKWKKISHHFIDYQTGKRMR